MLCFKCDGEMIPTLWTRGHDVHDGAYCADCGHVDLGEIVAVVADIEAIERLNGPPDVKMYSY